MTLRVAAAQYPIDALREWDAYAAKLSHWVAQAAAGGAQLAVFPEYGAMELTALDPASAGDLHASIAVLADLLPRIDELHRELAMHHGLHILAASTLRRDADGQFRNTARLFAPNGKWGGQDKLIMTRFEREQWGIAAGAGLKLFDTAIGRIAVNICYDSEFPLIARAQMAAGAEVLLVPSCTDSEHGYWRVRHGAQARALEGQCFAVQSVTVGEAEWSPAVDINRGAAGVYCTPDGGLPADGVLAVGAKDAAQWLFADLPLGEVARLRADGGVLNHAHWREQPGAGELPPVEVVDLR